MKIIREIKILRNLKTFLIRFVLFLAAFIVVDSTILVLSRVRCNSLSVMFLDDYNYLKSHISSVPDGIPQTQFSPVRVGVKQYYLKKIDTYYYPDAWNKPGRILLKRRFGNLYYVIFGDGTLSVLVHWSCREGKAINETDYLSLTNGSKCIFDSFSISCFYALIAAIIVLPIKKIWPNK